MDERYKKNERINRFERKKHKDNIYNSKHIRIALNNQSNSTTKTTGIGITTQISKKHKQK